MAWVDLIIVLALIQYLSCTILVGRARRKYDIKAPATTGHEIFERFYRVQMNTLELLVVFIPALWLAAKYWSPIWMGSIGAIYIIGRVIYLMAYIKNPTNRAIGFSLSMMSIVILILAALTGLIMASNT